MMIPKTSASEGENGEGYDSNIKIQKILASRTERRQRWIEICTKINTSEIENGSRWFQDEKHHSAKNSAVELWSAEREASKL
jgi:hypothetical protein